MTHPFRAGEVNHPQWASSRSRDVCVKDEGLIDPVSGGFVRKLSGTASVLNARLNETGVFCFFLVIANVPLVTLLGGYFSVGCAQNARQYIQYCLCFLTLPTKNYLADNRNSVPLTTTDFLQ